MDRASRAAGNAGTGERFMPCVLRRLIDFEPGSKSEAYERSITIGELRGSILENLRLIFASRFRPEVLDLGGDPEVVRSVLGFGISDFCGLTRSKAQFEILKREIIEQLRCFEPRLDPGSIRVDLAEDAGGPTVLGIRISGEVNVEPLKGEMICLSELDFESGFVTLRLED